MLNIESIRFLQFDFFFTSDQIEPLTVNTNISFTAQPPQETADPICALLIQFDSEAENIIRFHAKCRVVFRGSTRAELPKGEELIKQYNHQAYEAFCKTANDALVVLGQNAMEFPDLGSDLE